jgi:RHS repeat-associated protein
MTGSGFPSGVSAANVSVQFAPVTSGAGPTVTVPLGSLATLAGTTLRATVVIPASLMETAPTPYHASLSATVAPAFTTATPGNITVDPPPSLSSVNPASGQQGQTLNVTVTGSFSNFYQGISTANFGAGVTVNSVTVTSPTSLTANITIASTATLGVTNVVITTGSEIDTLTKGFTIVASPPTVSSFTPQSGTIGTIVTISGSSFGSAPQASMPGLNGGSIALPLQSLSASSIGVLIPSGAVTGPIRVANSGGYASTTSPFTVSAANTFSISAAPATATLITGQTVAYTVQLSSTNGFTQLARLSLSGLPSGVTASFKPSMITTGQVSVLTLSAPASQATGTSNLTITAAATVSGIPLIQTASANLSISGPTTSFLGQAVSSNSTETPLAGVVATMLGKDGGGNLTGCTGSTVSDGAGNIVLTNLSSSCVGPQLIGFNGSSVTSPAGQYASFNLVYTLVSGQATVSPVLIHLPPLDGAETCSVQQNAPNNQSCSFTSIPGLSLTVYAGTTFTQEDGTQPNPFPLVAVDVPVDRLPDVMPPSNTMVMPFIVAFQPANVVASQPVAVMYPSTLNTPPGTTLPLMTLNPTLGRMVPYGTATVSADGTTVVPNIDPSTGSAQHRFGIVNFDWHGWAAPPPNVQNPGPPACQLGSCDPPAPPCNGSSSGGGSNCDTAQNPTPPGDPVDVSSGLEVTSATDLAVQGTRGSISVQRIYRTLTATDGPFGLGSQSQYSWLLNTGSPSSASAINLDTPDGNQILFSRQTNGTLTNATIPWLQGSVMTTSGGTTMLRYHNGTVYTFQAENSQISALVSITDRNGNTTTLTQTPISPTALRITQITDPVGRSINLTYDSNGHALTATDPIGRTVRYTYNSTGTLATVTDPLGGVTNFQYDSQNRVTSLTDPRGVVTFQNSYDVNGRVSRQVLADSSVVQFAYTLVNPLVSASPVQATTVTDALGNQTTYRFNPQGFVTDVTDAIGQTKSFTLDPGTDELLQVTGPAQCRVCGPLGEGDRSFTYDGNGNKLTYTDALGNTTQYTYDPVFNQITSVTDPLHHAATYAYDGSGNLISVTDQNGNATTYAYDPTGLLLHATDPLGNSTAISYDELGNPVSITDALGNVTKIVFDAVSRPASVTDPLGKTTTLGFDALNRLISRRDGRGSTTQFAYDPVGNLLTITDPRGNATAFAYDDLSRILTRTSPLGKTETYQYDLGGNLVQFTDRRGQTGTFQYDALNRLVKESYQDGSVVSRAYDPYSRLLTVNDAVGGLFGFGYDLNGSIVSQSEPSGSINYTRDQLHRVATRQVAGQSAVTYSYDPAGNMLGASMPSVGITYSYDARNLPTSASRTNGVVSSYTLDSLGRVLSLIHFNGATAINTQTYSYDANGNRSSATSDIGQPLITQSAAATVDVANELLINAQTTYTNDANGNRLTETSSSGTVTYQWDSRNRLSSITDASGNVTSFKYDFSRNLIEMDKTAAGSVPAQRFVVDSLTNVVSLTDSSALPASVLSGRSIDSHYASVDSFGNVAFGIGDALGDIVGATNSGGAIASRFEYEPYGQITGMLPAAYPFSFTGRVPAGQIVYFRNRYYDSTTGRFLSEDPVSPGTSHYVYASNDPVGRVDPLGLADCSYYASQCNNNGGSYYCFWAPLACNITPEMGNWTRNVRGCLQNVDAYVCDPDPSTGCTLLAHLGCWTDPPDTPPDLPPTPQPICPPDTCCPAKPGGW